jgi:hypothetical protein
VRQACGPAGKENQTMNMNAENPARSGDTQPGAEQAAFDIRRLTVDQLAQLGMAQIAYVKPVVVNGTVGYAIHAANGVPMGLAEDRDVAIAAVLQHEMVPVPVH